jgi:hypothetical protein
VLVQAGQPSVAGQLAKRIADKDKVYVALRPGLEKMLRGPVEKQSLHAKTLLFESLNHLDAAEQAKTRAVLADWAFGDFSLDDPTNVLTEKLGKRLSPDEIERLGAAGIKGAEIMLSKAIAKNDVMAFLQALDTPEAKVALVNGLRRYHQANKKARVTEAELGFLQRTKHIEGLLYFFELYERLKTSEHPDDDRAAKMAIAAAVQWVDDEAGKKVIKESWDRLKEIVNKLLVGEKCDLRWWAAVQIVLAEGADGLKRALATLPDDTNYGQEEFALNDVKLMITDFCTKETSSVAVAVKRPLFIASLASERYIERIVAIRCLAADGSEEARKALVDFAEARKKLKEEKVIDALIVPQHAEGITLTDLAQISVEIIDYGRELDKLAAEGKLTAKQAEYGKLYAGFSFDRKGKALREFAETRAAAKLEKEGVK